MFYFAQTILGIPVMSWTTEGCCDRLLYQLVLIICRNVGVSGVRWCPGYYYGDRGLRATNNHLTVWGAAALISDLITEHLNQLMSAATLLLVSLTKPLIKQLHTFHTFPLRAELHSISDVLKIFPSNSNIMLSAKPQYQPREMLNRFVDEYFH